MRSSSRSFGYKTCVLIMLLLHSMSWLPFSPTSGVMWAHSARLLTCYALWCVCQSCYYMQPSWAFELWQESNWEVNKSIQRSDSWLYFLRKTAKGQNRAKVDCLHATHSIMTPHVTENQGMQIKDIKSCQGETGSQYRTNLAASAYINRTQLSLLQNLLISPNVLWLSGEVKMA